MARRRLQIALGCLWLLDGLFQLQPKMFTGSFAYNVILPIANGQPTFIAVPIHWAAALFLLWPAGFNLTIAAIQIIIGILILNKRTVKLGIAISVIWGMVVWIFGEALGGLFNGQFSLLTGSPGAVLIYALLGIAAYPSAIHLKPAAWLVYVWLVVWLVGAGFLMIQPNSMSNMRAVIISNAHSSPAWIDGVDNQTAQVLSNLAGHNNKSLSASSMTGMTDVSLKKSNFNNGRSSGYWLILLLGLIEIFAGAGIILNEKMKRLAIIIGSLLMLVFWIIGQSAGGYYSGLMTDLNTAPLMIILGICLYRLDINSYLEPVGDRIKQLLI